MMTFKSRSEAIKKADRITRYVNTVYPHVSESKAKEIISKRILYADFQDKRTGRLRDLALKFMLKMKAIRFSYTSGIELLTKIIRCLKDAKLGNCYEAAKMTELIGKINGQENIYPMKLLISRNHSGALMPLDHVVAVITKEKIEPDKKYFFTNKRAIIADPWLGVTEFPDKYLEKLRNDFTNLFPNMPDNDYLIRMLAKSSKNPGEFKQKRKNNCYTPQISFLLHEDGIVTHKEAEILKKEYPELIISYFKHID